MYIYLNLMVKRTSLSFWLLAWHKDAQTNLTEQTAFKTRNQSLNHKQRMFSWLQGETLHTSFPTFISQTQLKIWRFKYAFCYTSINKYTIHRNIEGPWQWRPQPNSNLSFDFVPLQCNFSPAFAVQQSLSSQWNYRILLVGSAPVLSRQCQAWTRD